MKRFGTSLACAYLLAISPMWAASPVTQDAKTAKPEAAPKVAKKAASKPSKKDRVEVEWFEAMENGTIEVKVTPKDATGGVITVKNKTDKPLRIKAPEAFAAVPAAQMGMGGMGGGGMGGMGGGGMGGMGGGMGGGGMGGGGQGMGGGMGGGGMGGGGMGGMGGGGMGGMGGGGMGGMGGGGMFNVGAGKTTRIKFVSVCLEHGKPDPEPRMKYTMIPLESFTKKREVQETVKMLVRGELSQNTAQAVAWHYTDGLSWEELTNKVKAQHLNGTVDMFFSPEEIHIARGSAVEAHRRGDAAGNAKEKAQSRSKLTANVSE